MPEQIDASVIIREAWAGDFDSCLRFQRRSWVRLRRLKACDQKDAAPDATARPEHVGYKHYSDDVVREFCLRAVDNGVSIIRIFDALNDVRNMETAFKASKAGAHVKVIVYVSPVPDIDSYVKLVKAMKSLVLIRSVLKIWLVCSCRM